MGDYRQYTKEEITQANQVDLEELMRRQGGRIAAIGQRKAPWQQSQRHHS